MNGRSLLESLPEIACRIDRAARILLALDFDGTLARICARPEDAVLAESVRTLLDRLDALPRVDVMIASGRSIADVRDRVGLPQLIYSGNHGLEISGGGLTFLEPTARAASGALQELAARMEENLANVPGVLVEKKGLTASIHYRNVPSELWSHIAEVTRQVVESEADRFALFAGRRVWEIRPRVSWHKGSAVKWVVEHLGDPLHRLVFVAGDDRTDEDAFASLREGVTIKVGEGEWTEAHYQVADPTGVEQFLGWLLAQCSGQQRAR